MHRKDKVREPLIKLNELIKIELPERQGLKEYPSRIADISDTDITLYPPTRFGNIIPLAPGTKIHIHFVVLNTLYILVTEVMKIIEEPVPFLVVKRRGKLQKIQRREYFRVQACLPVKIKINRDSQKNGEKTFYSKDISGGGICLQKIQRSVDEDTQLDIKIPINTNDAPIECIGKVKRCTRDIFSGEFELGICFDEIDEQKRDKIVKYVFGVEIETGLKLKKKEGK